MEGFTGENGAYDCAAYFQGDVGASSQVCIDNNRGKIWECVSRNNGAWTQCGYNSVSVAAEQSGYASWSRDYWLSNRSNQLHNLADWIAEEAAKFGIPIRALTASEAQGGGKGVCQHMNLGSTGCGHSDCGPNYPIDKVIEWAKGGSTDSTTKVDDVTAAAVFDPQGQLHQACIGTNNQIYYCPPGSSVYGPVDGGSNAKNGLGIAYNPTNNKIVIIYTNQDGNVCRYEKTEGSSAKWGWIDSGGNAR